MPPKKIPKALAADLKEVARLLAAGDPDAAGDVCARALDTPAGASHYRLRCLAGKCARARGDPAAARAHLAAAAALEPGLEPAWQGLEDVIAAQHAAADPAGDTRAALEDEWLDALEHLAACTSKKRKIRVKTAKVLEQSPAAARRARAWTTWCALVDSSKNDVQLRLPLQSAVRMILGADFASIVDGADHRSRRIDLLRRALDYDGDGDLAVDLAGTAARLVRETLVLPAQDGGAVGIGVEMEGLMARCRDVVLSHPRVRALWDPSTSQRGTRGTRAAADAGAAGVEDWSRVVRAECLPVFAEARLLPVLLARCCRLCAVPRTMTTTRSDGGHGGAANGTVAGGVDNGDDNSGQHDLLAQWLVATHPNRPVGRLWLATSESPPASFAAADAALEHSTLSLSWSSSSSSTSSSTSSPSSPLAPVVASFGRGVSHLFEAAGHLRCADLSLAGSGGSVLRGEGMAPGSERKGRLRAVVRHTKAGLAAVPWSASGTLDPLAAALRAGLCVCQGHAMSRQGAGGANDPRSSYEAALAAVAAAESGPDVGAIATAAKLGLAECDVYAARFEEARRRLEALGGDVSGQAGVVGLLGLADHLESNASHEGADESRVLLKRAVARLTEAVALASRSGAAAAAAPPAALADTHTEATLNLWLAQAMWDADSDPGTTTDDATGPGYRASRDSGGCFPRLIRAAKLRPGWGAPFGLLGRHYVSHAGGGAAVVSRGTKCLERALATDPRLETEGRLLVATLLANAAGGSERDTSALFYVVEPADSPVAKVRRVYEEAIARSGGAAAWAWEGLGALHMAVGRETVVSAGTADVVAPVSFDVDAAIECFQSLSRLRPTDPFGWILLGDAYAVATRRTAAHKSFANAIGLLKGSEHVREPLRLSTRRRRLLLATALRGMGEVELAGATVGTTAVDTDDGDGDDANNATNPLEHGIAHLRKALALCASADNSGAEEGVEKALSTRSLAAGLLALARQQLSSDMFQHARDNANEGLAVASTLTDTLKGILAGAATPPTSPPTAVSCLKLTGDLHALLGAMPPVVAGVDSPAIWTDNRPESGFGAKRQHLEAAVEIYASIVERLAPAIEDSSGPAHRAAYCRRAMGAHMDLGVALFRLRRAVLHNNYGERQALPSGVQDDDAKDGGSSALHRRAGQAVRTAINLGAEVIAALDNKGDQKTTDGAASTTVAELLADAWNVLGCIEASSPSLTSSEGARPLVSQYCFSRAIALSQGNHAQAWSNLGFLYVQCGLSGRALSAFMTSQSVSPASSVMWCGLGMVNARRAAGARNQSTTTRNRARKKALAAYGCAMEYFPHLRAKVGMGLTSLLGGDADAKSDDAAAIQDGGVDYEIAMACLQRAIDEDPCDARTRNALGVALLGLGRPADAVVEFTVARDLRQYQAAATAANGADAGTDQIVDNLAFAEEQVGQKAGAGGAGALLAASSPLSSLAPLSADVITSAWGCDDPMTSREACEQAVHALLSATRSCWWDAPDGTTGGSGAAAAAKADQMATLWEQMGLLLLGPGGEPESGTHRLRVAHSCIRFAVAIAGTSAVSTRALSLLAKVLGAREAASAGAREAEESSSAEVAESTETEGKRQASRFVMPFEELQARPAWVSLPLRYRRAQYGAKTRVAVLRCLVHADPACAAAWTALRESSS